MDDKTTIAAIALVWIAHKNGHWQYANSLADSKNLYIPGSKGNYDKKLS